MKVIQREVTARVVTSYQCEICGAKYRHKSSALACEARGIEENKFEIGDRVEAFEDRMCSDLSTFHMQGEVIAVLGPKITDRESIRWVFADEKGWAHKHVYIYIVKYRCGICNKKEKAPYFSPEIKKISK